MTGRLHAFARTLLNCSIALGQAVVSVDLLDPGDARIAVNISGVPGASDKYDLRQITTLANIPSGATVVLMSAPIAPFGTSVTTFDVPNPAGIGWAISSCPEPAAATFALLGIAVFGRRRQ